MRYPGLAYVGNGQLVGLYGLNETIHDQKSIGLQHLYVENYETDYIYSALSVVQVDDWCYYGDRIKPLAGHPQKQKSAQSTSEKGFVFTDTFAYEAFEKKDRMYCANDTSLVFECQVKNTSQKELKMQISSLIVTTNHENQLYKKEDEVRLTHDNQCLYVQTQDEQLVCRASKESPSGFMYRGIQNLLYKEKLFEEGTIISQQSLVVSLTKTIHLKPFERHTFKWAITTQKKRVDFEKSEQIAVTYWQQWLAKTRHKVIETSIPNLIALKAVNMNGFIPADLTGHYFASDNVSFYVRDALHAARAFLYSGYYDECKQIIECVDQLQRRENHEIYQRYNARRLPDEGANNNVFSQIDFIGYLLRVVADFYHLTQELILPLTQLIEDVHILGNIAQKNGLYGPEGGVNEGVYGPAYITSTNIFITGGIIGLVEIIQKEQDPVYSQYLPGLVQTIQSLITSINRTYLEEGYFAYGYVEYDEQLVKRYDTPQLFGASLGYPMDTKYIQNFYTLSKIALYYDYGYGYSEQQYHDGPWLFNTAFAAQNAYLLKDKARYDKIMQWIDAHKNAYGLLPEAIDARDENNSFINPLMWANAEYICAQYSHIIQKIRNEVSYDR